MDMAFIPFGAAVDFLRTPVIKQENKPPKFAPTGVRGIILGYRIHPGGRWRKEYEVAELNDFVGVDLAFDAPAAQMQKVRVQTVQEVLTPKGPWTFPLRADYVKRNQTLEGLKAAQPDLPPLPRPGDDVEPLNDPGGDDGDNAGDGNEDEGPPPPGGQVVVCSTRLRSQISLLRHQKSRRTLHPEP